MTAGTLASASSSAVRRGAGFRRTGNSFHARYATLVGFDPEAEKPFQWLLMKIRTGFTERADHDAGFRRRRLASLYAAITAVCLVTPIQAFNLRCVGLSGL